MLPINQPSAALRAWTVTVGDGQRLALDIVLDQARVERGAAFARSVRLVGRALARLTTAVFGTSFGAEQYRPYLR